MAKEIFGNQALLVTPMMPDGSLDIKSLQGMIDYVIEGGVHGILLLGSTGEFFSLTARERCEVMRAAADQTRGRVALGLGTADTGTALVVQTTAEAAAIGADYVLVTPPYYSPLAMNTEEGLLQFFKAIGTASSVPVMLYDGGAGIEIPTAVIRRISKEVPKVRAIKLNVANPAKVSAVKDAGLLAFCGTDALTMLMLGYGIDGFTLGVANLLPRETTALYDRFSKGEKQAARDVFYSSLLPFINVTLASLPQYIACFKMVLYWKGLIQSPAVRPPLVPLDETRSTELKAVAQRIGLI
ncbi:MAG: dihydrodipicolinate synthase family protein [Terracidiphilus sp.]|jgi:4-hydroxy-tetrahydrodipicolinate synthase